MNGLGSGPIRHPGRSGERRRKMTVSAPPTLEAPTDVEFDLDVKLEPVDRHLAADRPMRPTECSCVECDTNAATCTGCP